MGLFLERHSYKRFMLGMAACVLAMILAMAYASTAMAQAIGTGSTVSEQEVYDNLDDHDLSLRYAKQQIKKGEMLNAAAALERMLYANPNWHSARLLYAAVLYRLDDQKAALRELSLLEGKELNEDQIETYARYSSAFTVPPRPVFAGFTTQDTAPATGTGITANSYSTTNNSTTFPTSSDPVKASITLAVRGDNNAGNALTDEGFGFDNRGDVSGVVQGRFRASTPLSSKGNVTARIDASGLLRRHETFDQADYDVFDIKAGLSTRTGGGRMSFDVDTRRINIAGEKYLEQIGPRVTFTQAVSDTTRATVSLSAYSQNYDPLSFAAREDERDGWKTSLQVGILKKIKDSQRLTAVVGYETKSAEISPFAYKGPVASLGYEVDLNNDYIVKTQIRARRLNYNGSFDAQLNERKDTRLSARASVGKSIGELFNTKDNQDVSVELGVNYHDRNSNIDANDFDNLGADLRLTVDF